jgi:6-pyruvoyltetrahydropterin/6-carboxytetrahydropterin synthase
LRLTRRYRFSASHRLHAPQLSPEQNSELYGRCNNPFGHGHDYTIEVQVSGRVDPRTGVLIEIGRMDRLVRRAVIEPFDHRNLNTDIAEFRDCVPTSENLAVEAGKRLQSAWREEFGVTPVLEKVRIHETARNIFELLL